MPKASFTFRAVPSLGINNDVVFDFNISKRMLAFYKHLSKVLKKEAGKAVSLTKIAVKEEGGGKGTIIIRILKEIKKKTRLRALVGGFSIAANGKYIIEDRSTAKKVTLVMGGQRTMMTLKETTENIFAFGNSTLKGVDWFVVRIRAQESGDTAKDAIEMRPKVHNGWELGMLGFEEGKSYIIQVDAEYGK